MIKTKTNSCGNRRSFTAATAKSQTKNLFSDVRFEWVVYASRRPRPGNHMLYKMKQMVCSPACSDANAYARGQGMRCGLKKLFVNCRLSAI